MNNKKKIAIICNYALSPNRIGGMDRFWVAYDAKAKTLGTFIFANPLAAKIARKGME